MKLSEEIISILDAMCAKFGMAVDWTSENVIPYMTELAEKCVRYELITSIMWVAVFAVLVFVCFAGSFACYKLYNKIEDANRKEAAAAIGIVLMVIAAVLFCLFIVVALAQAHDIIACLTFPEKILLQFVKGIRI